MGEFTFAGNYELFDAEPQKVVTEVWAHLHRRLTDSAPGIRTAQVEFDDAKMPDEEARRFVVMHTDTRRGTLVSTNAFFRPYGNHLYFSVRSYVLPPLSVVKLVLWTLFSLVLLSNAAAIIIPLSMIGLGFLRPVALFIVLGILAFVFRTFIRSVRAGDTFHTALRKQFPKRFDWGTFNNDDVLAFLKTNVTITMRSVADVLEKHGIDVSGLLRIIQNIEINNIDTKGGNIIASVVGGRSNTVTAK
jgi:hypothetical protein